MNTYAHTGDLGDIVASLPAVRALGTGHYVIYERPVADWRAGYGRDSLKGARFDAIRPMLLAQPCIASVTWSDAKPKAATHDFSGFRHDAIRGENLAHWQARNFGVEISLEPWLCAKPSPLSAGRVIIARSARYHAHGFPWRDVLRLCPEAMFVGLPDEHARFQAEYICRLPFVPTENLMELAELIAGAKCFIGNQSCPAWIAMGLGARVLMEVSPYEPNSIVPRDGSWFPQGPAQYRWVPKFIEAVPNEAPKLLDLSGKRE